MKRQLITLAALFAAVLAHGQSDPAGTISYALPKTVIVIEVDAIQESFHAGPYARYASKYLGINARSEDSESCIISAVRIRPVAEADQQSRYLLSPGKSMPAFLSLTAQGLVSTGDGAAATDWRFSSESEGDFSGKGISSNLTSSSATLYGNREGSRFAVQQEMVIQKTQEQRAKEAAEMIFKLRQKRIDIVTGDTDATFAGEALGAAIAEINRLENEYLSLFVGYSDLRPQTMNYEIIPDKENSRQAYIAFRASDSKGLVPADETSGKPYILQLSPEKISEAQGSASSGKGTFAWYRIPAICTATLSDGATTLLSTRIPVYQLGTDSNFPIYN